MSSRQKIFINTLQSCYYLISTLLSGSTGSNWSRACKNNTNYVLFTTMSAIFYFNILVFILFSAILGDFVSFKNTLREVFI